MRAHVARHARQALARQLAPTAWPHLAVSTPRSTPIHARICVRRPTYRTFITSLLQKPPRDVRESEYEPGWMDIMVWRSRMLDNLAPPPPDKLRHSWIQFFNFKLATHRPLNSTQALQCRRLLEYLSTPGKADYLTPRQIGLAVKALSSRPGGVSRRDEQPGPEHVDFAHALLRSLRIDFSKGIDDEPLAPRLLEMLASIRELRIAAGAFQIFLKDSATLSRTCAKVVTSGCEEDLNALIEWGKTKGTGLENFYIRSMAIQFYAERDRVAETQSWVENQEPETSATYPKNLYTLTLPAWSSLAPFAARNGLQDWAKTLLQRLAEQKPPARHWQIIVAAQLWLGGGLKGAEAVMSNMTMGPDKEVKPQLPFINKMLEVAVQKGDEQLANDITSMAADKNITPDILTFMHWMQLKTDAGNFEGARFSFDRIRVMSFDDVLEPGTPYRAVYENTLNKFLGLACAQKRPDFSYITEVLDHVDEAQIRLEPGTVAQLSLRFLENEQFLDVMDLLAINAFKYGEAERQVVQSAFVAFCLDSNISTSRAWSAYQVLEQYFPDLERTERVKLMEEFFRRKRPDMAVKVFGAMRNHRSPAYRPDESMYRRCFEGLARNPDLDSTQQAHNWLKTDSAMELSTRLFTALMLAFTACGRSLTALDFWKEVTACKEGPGYSTLAAVFWALEKRPNGAKMAQQIWDRIESMDVEVPPDVYNAYVGAIAGSGQLVEAQKIIVNMASFVGSEPTALTLGIAYNALPGRELQKEFETWAKMKYRECWAELEKYGRRMNELQLCQFKVQRPLEAY